MRTFKKYFALFMAVILSVSCVSCAKTADINTETTTVADNVNDETVNTADIENLLVNGDFSDGLTGWQTAVNNGGALELNVVDGEAVADISSLGNAEDDVQIFCEGFALERNGVYEISFDLNSDISRKIDIRIQQNGGSNRQYYDKHLDVKAGAKKYSFKFSMKSKSDNAPRMYFNLGLPKADADIKTNTITLDNVVLSLIEMRDIIDESVNEKESDKEQQQVIDSIDNGNSINLNQVGFLTNARKTCVVRAENAGDSFTIIDLNGTEVYSGKLDGPNNASFAGETVWNGDFSDFNTPGKYKIKISNGDTSNEFEVGDNVYDNLLKDALKMLTIQRCGTEVTSDYAGKAAHPVCHNTEAVIYGTDIKKEVSGGWHDAGDYGRYVVAGATSVGDLFLSYEDFPQIWSSDDLGIPESGNGVPDILDEARYELDWMLKMQDEASGGVYHKVTCYAFPGFIMPQLETEELVICPISNTATGDFAAVMAKASVLYKDYDSAFSDRALKSAVKAYEYLEQHMDAKGFTNPKDVVTGDYADGSFTDEMYWAAVELYKCTEDEKYKNFVEDSINKNISHGFGWVDMGAYGNVEYLSMDEDKQNPELVAKLTASIDNVAKQYLDNSNRDGYKVALGGNYCWGSNLSVCGYARLMLLAAKYNNAEAYNNAAYDQLSYLLGQNATGYSFVTGYGTRSPKNPHHRVSFASGAVVPGMVVGGPNGALEDDYAKKMLQGAAPAKAYVDHMDSYSTNEVAIYWNSPFVYLLSAVIEQNK